MFGHILSSLGQFKEESKRSVVVSKRSLIDKKVQQSLAQEDEKIHEEQLKRSRELQTQKDLDRLKNRIESLRKEAKLLRTKSKPSISYKPYTFTDAEEDILDKQFDEAEDEVDRLWDEFHVKYPDIKRERTPIPSDSESDRDSSDRELPAHPVSPKNSLSAKVENSEPEKKNDGAEVLNKVKEAGGSVKSYNTATEIANDNVQVVAELNKSDGATIGDAAKEEKNNKPAEKLKEISNSFERQKETEE